MALLWKNMEPNASLGSRKSFPSFNHVELKAWTERHAPELMGARIERVFIPHWESHPEGYFKKEWCLEVRKNRNSAQFFFSLSPQHCALALLTRPLPFFRAETRATHSPFGLTLQKQIENRIIESVIALPEERILKLTLAPNEDLPALCLYLILIPAQAEGVLTTQDDVILASTKTNHRTGSLLPLPKTSETKSTATFSVRNLETYENDWLAWRKEQSANLLRDQLLHKFSAELKTWQKRLISYVEQKQKAENDSPWETFGNTLLAHQYANPKPKGNHYSLEDFASGKLIQIPYDPKLTYAALIQKCFKLAKRNKARIHESQERIESSRAKVQHFEKLLNQIHASPNLDALRALIPAETHAQVPSAKLKNFSGHSFVSEEGLPILVGKNQAENLELTFKIAKGQDLWMHVKNKPGSHVCVLLPPKRTANLETLLDAANLCIYFSGGKNWGKTEVDYTLRKNVKKVKKQTDVIYHEYKTLTITPDPKRLERLLGSR